MEEIIVQEIRAFLDDNMRLTKLPKKRRKFVCALIYIASKFDSNTSYTEPEVNDILEKWHNFGDKATLRRSLCDMGFLDRTLNCSEYKLISPTPNLNSFDAWIRGLKIIYNS